MLPDASWTTMVLWMVAKSCTTKRMVFQLVQDFSTIHIVIIPLFLINHDNIMISCIVG